MSKDKFKFMFPFEPPWEDLRMVSTAPNGLKAYVFDSCVVDDPEERSAIDRRVAQILIRSERRRFLQWLTEEDSKKL